MNYSPTRIAEHMGQYQSDIARQTGAGIGMLFREIPKIAQRADAKKQVEGAYRQIVGEFRDKFRELGMDDVKALTTAKRYILPPMSGESPEDSLSRILDSSEKATKAYNEMLVQKKDEQLQAQYQGGVTKALGRQQVVGPEEDTGKGFTEQDIASVTPPPATRGEAMARYGEASARGAAPYKTVKDLEQDPRIAALPETTPEQDAAKKAAEAKPDPLASIKEQTAKLRLEGQRLDNEKKKRELSGGLKNTDYEDALKLRMSVQRQYNSASTLVKSLEQAANKLTNNVAPQTLNELKLSLEGVGYTGEINENALTQAIADATNMRDDLKDELAVRKAAEDRIRKASKSPLARATQESVSELESKKEDQIQDILKELGPKIEIAGQPARSYEAMAARARIYAAQNKIPESVVNEAMERWGQGDTKRHATEQPPVSQVGGQEGIIRDQALKALADVGITSPNEAQIAYAVNKIRQAGQ